MSIRCAVRHRLDALAERWQRLATMIRDPYRPEKHYMRGPGPKWHAKNGLHMG
jgi:hypothetical protein